MPGEDQERFEDYLELERYIESLREGKATHPPLNLTPTQASIYRMAALFHSASPEVATPRPEFVDELRARLLAFDVEEQSAENKVDALLTPSLLEQDDVTQPRLPAVKLSATPTPASIEPETHVEPQEQPIEVQQPQHGIPQRPQRELPQRPQRARFFSRRSLITGSAVAAASLVVGGGIGEAIKPPAEKEPAAASTTSKSYNTPLVMKQHGTLHFVATLDKIKESAVRFATDTIVGYVIRSDGDAGEAAGAIIAVSAACTHMGCLVQWQEKERQFLCPCHGGLFTEYGKPAPHSAMRYLASLPRMQTVVHNNNVYVVVPK